MPSRGASSANKMASKKQSQNGVYLFGETNGPAVMVSKKLKQSTYLNKRFIFHETRLPTLILYWKITFKCTKSSACS